MIKVHRRARAVLIFSFLFQWVMCASSKAAASEQALSVRSSMRWLSYISLLQTVDDSPANPDNTQLQRPNQKVGIDIRPDIKATSGVLKIIARPLLEMVVSKAKVGGIDQTEHPKSTGRWIESYGILSASEKIQVSFGLQNYQWGAAESLNPSNRIFHESVGGKDLLYAVEGRQIARINISWTKNLNTVLMSETDQAKDLAIFRWEETFQTKALMKHELNWNSGADYFGVVFGSPEKGTGWFGEYFNASITDGLSLYLDAAHQKNSPAWYPVVEKSPQAPTQDIVQLRQSKLSDNKVYTLAVLGTRYSFEGGSDVRLEYISNDAGWTKEENERAVLALDLKLTLQSPFYQQNFWRIMYPGLEYRGRRFALTSLRVPDAFDLKDLTLYGRILRSLTDGSSTFYGSVEYAFWSASTFILSAYLSQGEPDSELRGIFGSVVTAGVRQDF